MIDNMHIGIPIYLFFYIEKGYDTIDSGIYGMAYEMDSNRCLCAQPNAAPLLCSIPCIQALHVVFALLWEGSIDYHAFRISIPDSLH